MKRRLFFISLVVGATAAALSQPRPDQCFTCHQTLEDRPSQLFSSDIHRANGVTCADCHGGDPHAEDMEVAMNRDKGFLGVPRGDKISQTCERCHSDADRMKSFRSTLHVDQGSLLNESIHGRLSVTGKERMVQCTTCHGAHGIVSKRDNRSPVHPLNVTKTCGSCHSDAAYMRQYNPSLPVDQVQKYRTSVHGILNARGDANVAECASCHGSHDIRAVGDVKSAVYATNLPSTCATCHSDVDKMKRYKIPASQFDDYAQSVHGKALMEKHDLAAPACNDCHGNHGAAPPGVQSVSQVCGTCHALNAELFSKSPHKKAFDSRKLPECETCHGNHKIIAATDQLLGISTDAVCSQCHGSGKNDPGYLAARTMRELTDSLHRSEERARLLVEEAEQKGMEISAAKFKLRDVRQARLESRTMVHSFDQKQFEEVIGKGFASATTVSNEAQASIDEYYFRRLGLGISTLIISILALSLYLTIRRLERKS